MRRWPAGAGAAGSLLILAACARYHPSPIEPPRLEQEYRNRGLADPGLRGFVEKKAPRRAAAWPPAKFDLDALLLVAGFYNPELHVVRARLQTAEAAVISAGGRPNPTLASGLGYSNSPESNLVARFEPAFTLETAGKRGHRILQARKLAEAGRLEVLETEWRVRSRVRAALVEHILARRTLDVAGGEAKTRLETAAIYENRLSAGEVSRPEADAARLESSTATAALRAAEGRAAETRAALAAALGVPVTAIETTPVEWPSMDSPPRLAVLPLEKVQQAGLLNRADVSRALAEYAAAEAALRLEISRQYPDIQIGPGYSFDEAHHKIMIGPGLPVPVLNRNRGPIAEAEARRKELQVRFIALQAQAIAEMEQALARYRAAELELEEAGERLLRIQRQREAAVRRAFAAGGEDRLALARVRLEAVAAGRTHLEALRRAQLALGALEDAVQRPLE